MGWRTFRLTLSKSFSHPDNDLARARGPCLPPSTALEGDIPRAENENPGHCKRLEGDSPSALLPLALRAAKSPKPAIKEIKTRMRKRRREGESHLLHRRVRLTYLRLGGI